MEPVSPELVLVDAKLRVDARSRLAQPDDTLARVDALVQASRMAALALKSMDMPRRPPHEFLGPPRRTSRRPRPSAIVAGGVAGALVIALLVGVRVDLNGTLAGADTAAVDEVPLASKQTQGSVGETLSEPRAGSTPPASKRARAGRTQPTIKPTRAGGTPSPIKLAPQRFAWAPTAGASAYHVELFRGSSKVFEADTKRPDLTVPARWVFGQRSQSLEPGDYRWYVWPVIGGRRAVRAIVQAKLVVPAR